MYLSHLNMGRKNSLHTKEINFDPKKTFPFLRITLSEKDKYDEIYIVAIEMLLGIAYGLLNVGAWNKILKHVVTELQTNRFDIATDFIDQVVHPIKKVSRIYFQRKTHLHIWMRFAVVATAFVVPAVLWMLLRCRGVVTRGALGDTRAQWCSSSLCRTAACSAHPPPSHHCRCHSHPDHWVWFEHVRVRSGGYHGSRSLVLSRL